MDTAAIVRLPSRDIAGPDIARMAEAAARATACMTGWGTLQPDAIDVLPRDREGGSSHAPKGVGSSGSRAGSGRPSRWQTGSSEGGLQGGQSSVSSLVTTADTAAAEEAARAKAEAKRLEGPVLSAEASGALQSFALLVCKLARSEPLDFTAARALPVLRCLLAVALHATRQCRAVLGMEMVSDATLGAGENAVAAGGGSETSSGPKLANAAVAATQALALVLHENADRCSEMYPLLIQVMGELLAVPANASRRANELMRPGMNMPATVQSRDGAETTQLRHVWRQLCVSRHWIQMAASNMVIKGGQRAVFSHSH